MKIFWPFKDSVHNRVLSPENITTQNQKGPHTLAAASGNY